MLLKYLLLCFTEQKRRKRHCCSQASVEQVCIFNVWLLYCELERNRLHKIHFDQLLKVSAHMAQKGVDLRKHLASFFFARSYFPCPANHFTLVLKRQLVVMSISLVKPLESLTQCLSQVISFCVCGKNSHQIYPTLQFLRICFGATVSSSYAFHQKLSCLFRLIR